ncbi:MAG TPA: MarR family winged helix-turn-helix transcriptional regulator [Propionibacteriaceae bacterium]|nr:MarR family winged helix-turn-helix transcriptional regulator [Propionibacteriaceae bacterium]
MTVARSVADVLDDHVVFEVESIDRMYLNVWQPRLAYGGGVQGFFVGHRGYHYASTALMDPMTQAFVADIHGFVAARGLDLVSFAKGQRKDDLAQQFLARFTDEEGVLFVGRAQEKAGVWRTQRRYSPSTGGSYAWLVRSSAFINFFYFYCVDADFGPFFLKFSTYFPYTAKLCINGNEWAKRQAAKAGIGYEPLDNGFASCDDVPAVQAICDRLGPEHIDALLRKWLRILPHPFAPEDEAAGYRYELSILQAEFSLTQMLDRPVSGRIFFEQVLHDNLDIGRPDHVSLVFDRRVIRKGRSATPGRFRTRVITNGVVPSLHIDYKNTKIKQYHKEGRALRTETTINDTRDFGLSKRLTNLPALRQIGFSANRRLLGVQRLSHDPIRGAASFVHLTAPIVTDTGTRIPGLRFGDVRVHALLQALLIHRLLPHGFTNRELRALVASLLGTPTEDITAGKMTYDLRRLRAHGLITRVPRSRRYQITDTGLTQALLFTHAHNHLLRTGLAEITDPDPPAPSRLRAADRAYHAAFDELARYAHLAA